MWTTAATGAKVPLSKNDWKIIIWKMILPVCSTHGGPAQTVRVYCFVDAMHGRRGAVALLEEAVCVYI